MLPKEHQPLVYDVLEINEHDWYGDEYIRGACFPSMGPNLYHKLGPELKTSFLKIHFAGTETASVFRGYMEGAVESGERSATEVISVLRSGGLMAAHSNL